MNVLLKAVNPITLTEFVLNLARLFLATWGNFSALKKYRKYGVNQWQSHKNCFLTDISAKLYFVRLHRQSTRLRNSVQHQIWHWDTRHVWSCNWEFNILKLLSGANQCVKTLKRVKNFLFWYVFESPMSYVSLINFKSVTEVARTLR